MKYKQISIVLENYREWIIHNDGSVYFLNELTGACWESDIAIFRDYTNEILYEQFIEEVEDEENIIPFHLFASLVADSFTAFEL
ncbi:hypothetical protein STP4a_057 [Salmonella phage STP4-a]|uniref:Uncharacterized protein n=1 Tax=Salmonella phage STP4-a TaxID=1445860 RepID=A0A0B4L996_9CAUD|nr:hypothetical protein STP4a_057 [Salmonella phage STP4-a]AHJ86912.1 hypothetical protein STP4a_057 [Salmonella phage STP4-a]UFK27184.1 hypothetical protein LG358_00163 [Escherichia phage UoN_LG358_1]WKV23408.1 hypothetical protein SEA1_gp0060 [Salmonella phage SEA1]